MRKLLLASAVTSLVLVASAGAASPRELPALPPVGAEEAPLFAAGGTHLTNGIFFPGTALCVGKDCYGVPYQVAAGSDIRFYNLDPVVVANSHRIISRKTNKRGRPLFQSDNVAGPGSSLMKTRHLKPGVYGYYCAVHFGMEGLLEFTE